MRLLARQKARSGSAARIVGVSLWPTKVLIVLACLLLLIPGSSLLASGPIPVSSTFFGQHVPNGVLEVSTSSPLFPRVGFGSMRLWDSKTYWSSLEPARGSYNWTTLDRWISLANRNGKDVLYTFGRTPQWASLRPGEPCAGGNKGCAAPPADVSDGDQYWKEFVTALVSHSMASRSGKIRSYELWNEGDSKGNWTGTNAQMLQMAKDAYAIIHSMDPGATILTPSISSCCGDRLAWLSNYFAAGGAATNAQNGVAFHTYPQDSEPQPTALPGNIAKIRSLMASYGIENEPLWATEGCWSSKGPTSLSDDQQAAYLAQQYLFLWNGNVARYYWYAWGSAVIGGLLDRTRLDIKPAGEAYGQLHDWLVGSTSANHPCSQARSDGTWSCSLTLADGNAALILWNPTTPKSFAIDPDSGFTQYRTLDNSKVNTISADRVPIGAKPIMLVAAVGQ